MTTNNRIEFAPVTNGQHRAPWDRKGQSTYEDLIFKDEFVDRRLKLEVGPNWIRVIPTMMDSKGWMLKVPAVAMKHGRFAHPRTLQERAKCAFDHAYRWFVANDPGKLFNRENPTGHRLLCDSLCAFWCLMENKEGKVEARLFLGSSHNGSGNGTAGLGYRIWQKLSQHEDVDVISEPMHFERGTMICIEKSQPAKARFASYHVRVGRRATPIQELLDRMEPSEFDVICPIEKTIRELTDDEQWEHLARIIGAATADTIRSSVR